MKLRELLRPKRESQERDTELTLDQWVNQWKQYGNNALSWGGGYAESGKQESIPNDFIGYVNGAYKSSGAVFACCLTRMLIFSEARFAFQEFNRAKPGDLVQGPGLEILDNPWPNGTTGELLSRAIQDADFAGNFYAVREDKPGQPPRFRRLRPDWVLIVLSADPTEALASDVIGYIYKPGNTGDKSKWETYPIDGSNGAVVHWSPIPDPDAQYRGMSWLTPVIRETMGDKAIGDHKLKFFEKGATPNIAVSMHESVTPDQAKEFRDLMDAKYSGLDNAYKTMYLGGGADVTTIGANIQQMDFATVTGIGETRIAAAARVHPAIVGLSSGLEGSSLNSGNFEAAKDNLASGTMRPLWRSFCAALDHAIDKPAGTRLWFDASDVAFLREDREKVARRQQVEATSISRYVMQGFTPDSAVEAILADDISLLKHTGLYSVQLLPPNISHPETAPPEGDGTTKKPASGKAADGKSDANNNPTGSKRKPVGRPPKETKDAAWLEAVERGQPWEDQS